MQTNASKCNKRKQAVQPAEGAGQPQQCSEAFLPTFPPEGEGRPQDSEVILGARWEVLVVLCGASENRAVLSYSHRGEPGAAADSETSSLLERLTHGLRNLNKLKVSPS